MVDVPELLLRQAEATDARRLREWRNDPATRAASRNTAPVDAGAHEAWFASVIANPDRHLLVADEDRTPVGSLRFDRRAELCYEISVVVAPEARGRGLGTALIRAGLGWLREHAPGAVVVAEVRPENRPSVAAFSRAGFRGDGGPASEGLQRLVLVTPPRDR